MQDMKLLISMTDEFQLSAVVSILEENQIPFITKDNGLGNYMRIYSGRSIYGTDILVREDCFDKANDLIANFREDDEE